MIKKFLLLVFFLSQMIVVAQDKKEDETKLIREVVKLEVDKTKFAPPVQPAAPVVADTKGKKGKKHHEEPPPPPPVEEGASDTTNPFIPAPQAEVLKRAQNWYTVKPAAKFVKSNGTNTGKSVACQVTFPFKQKVLNPENEVDGSITMDLIIEAKEGKYRYTIKNIKHQASKSDMSCGDVYGVVPECGSMKVSDRTWKTIKKEAFLNAQVVAEDLKAVMIKDVDSKKDEW